MVFTNISGPHGHLPLRMDRNRPDARRPMPRRDVRPFVLVRRL